MTLFPFCAMVGMFLENGKVCMENKQCDWCGDPLHVMGPFRGRPQERFCCSWCAQQWHTEEKRQAVALYRLAGLKPDLPWRTEVAK
jgi:hypothetical protein